MIVLKSGSLIQPILFAIILAIESCQILLSDSLVRKGSFRVELFRYVFGDFHCSYDDWFLVAVASSGHD